MLSDGCTFDVENPATGEILATPPPPGRTCARPWTPPRTPRSPGPATYPPERSEILRRASTWSRHTRRTPRRCPDDPGDGQAAEEGPGRGGSRSRVPALVLRGGRAPRLLRVHAR
ncbi:hypothetical protein QJS66_10270 [Kocuria rhizophila]|nr:hypothetical protein QJS66_10270 [Kocuria rhizophila]